MRRGTDLVGHAAGSLGLPTVDPAAEATGAVDYKALFEAEVQKTRSLEGRVGALMQQVSKLTAQQQTGDAGANRLGRKISDRRLGIASSLFEALIVRDGVPQGDDLIALAENAVDAADALLDALVEDGERDDRR